MLGKDHMLSKRRNHGSRLSIDRVVVGKDGSPTRLLIIQRVDRHRAEWEHPLRGCVKYGLMNIRRVDPCPREETFLVQDDRKGVHVFPCGTSWLPNLNGGVRLENRDHGCAEGRIKAGIENMGTRVVARLVSKFSKQPDWWKTLSCSCEIVSTPSACTRSHTRRLSDAST